MKRSHTLMGFCTCSIRNLYGDNLGLLGVSMGWGQLCACHFRKQINKERIKIGRSPDRQANEAIPIVVFSQKSERREGIRPILD